MTCGEWRQWGGDVVRNVAIVMVWENAGVISVVDRSVAS